jgi:DNA polymerase III epsilon subunit-like protein
MKEYGKEISSNYKYIFFDEFQDVNDTQFNLLKIFVDNGCYLSVIGDDCQNIYQFRGTNNYYMINYDRIIPNTKTYFLEINYRSSPNIINLANKSISYNQHKVDKTMKPCNKDNIPSNKNGKAVFQEKPLLIINDKEEDTYKYIIDKIKYYINKGYKYDDICILSRNTYPLKMMETELTKNDISHIALITDKNGDDTKKLIEPNKVVVTSIHKSKGLEWSIVFIIGLSHQHFPEHLNNNIKNIEEERRLFYVGTTRAKTHLEFVANLSELPLSIFIKECQEHIDVKNNTKQILNDYLGGSDVDNYTKKIYGVNELIGMLNEYDLDNLRNNNTLPNVHPEIEIIYENSLLFTETIKKNAFEPDVGEFCDRYITRNIMNNLNTDFIDVDTEEIIELPNSKRLQRKLCDLTKPFNYPDNVINQIKQSYKNIKTSSYTNYDIYWISLCRNFKSERRRLVYRDIFNLIETNILIGDESDNLKNRMDYYVNYFSNKINVNCKVNVCHEFKNYRKEKCYIFGEIDLISNDTIIDFKCSESDFKLEWLLQLLLYYTLLDDDIKQTINKVQIINIMNGREYTFNIPDDYNEPEKKGFFIKFLETKINNDQQSIRNSPNNNTIDYSILNNNTSYDDKYEKHEIEFNKQTNQTENFMVLDTETADLNGDIIQLSYIVVDNDMNIVKKVNKYIKDRIPSSETISIHNITINKLRTKGSDFNDVINTFIKDLENVDYIVGHNVGYDLRVIINNLRKYEITIITDNKVNNNIFSNIPIKDTYQMSKKSLEQLHQELFNLPVYGAHNAINDVLATFECYKKIIASSMQF